MMGTCLLVRDGLSQLTFAVPFCLGWTTDTFIDSDAAETDLCRDRTAVVLQHELMMSVPSDIMKHIVHPDATAQIKGSQELFVLLNTAPEVDHLRRLVVNYFNASPWLRAHLREPRFAPNDRKSYLCDLCIYDSQNVQALARLPS
jgi:hypothetical protein